MSGTRVPMGNSFQLNIYGLTLSPTSVSSNNTSEQTFTFVGLGVTDLVYVSKPSTNAGVGIGNARVSAANTLAIEFFNVTAATVTPTASELYTLLHIRSEYNPLQTAL